MSKEELKEKLKQIIKDIPEKEKNLMKKLPRYEVFSVEKDKKDGR